MNSPLNYKWKQLLDIIDSDLPLTPVLCPCNSHARMWILRVSWVSVIEFVNANDGVIVNRCFGDIENYLENGKLEKVVAIIKSCTPNALDDLTWCSGSGMLDEEEIIKLLEEEMVDLELQVCGNVTDQDDQYELDKEALNLTLEEGAWVEQEWLEKCRQEQELD
uniref:Uncharacterized protein n=1 Tax=Tanacetum cinerariifolium TaxID=118510 RepID=A0A6L2MLP6_TANCI|nr:hypothetical protein [Tanacetum cinerariifolium]